MSLEHILLGMLREPSNGYELRRAFDSGPRHFWSAELSQIYPALQAMEKRGWLASRREPSITGPARRVYQRTAAGQRALRAWLLGEPDIGKERLAYLGQLVFLAELGDRRQTKRFLEALRRRWIALHDWLEAGARALRDEHGASLKKWSDDDVHELLCLEMGVRAVEGRIAGCTECIKLLRKRG